MLNNKLIPDNIDKPYENEVEVYRMVKPSLYANKIFKSIEIFDTNKQHIIDYIKK